MLWDVMNSNRSKGNLKLYFLFDWSVHNTNPILIFPTRLCSYKNRYTSSKHYRNIIDTFSRACQRIKYIWFGDQVLGITLSLIMENALAETKMEWNISDEIFLSGSGVPVAFRTATPKLNLSQWVLVLSPFGWGWSVKLGVVLKKYV